MTLKELPLSVTIIVRNEEDNLPACIASLPKNCEVIVVDSGSSDATVSVATELGARVYSNPFNHYAQQKNFALAKATRAWILSLDADERLSPTLRDAIASLVLSPQPAGKLYALKRQLFFMGRAMRFGRTIDFPVRLCMNGQAQFTGDIHEVLKPLQVGTVARTLSVGAIYHHSYRDLSDYFTKFNRYTSMMAEQRLSRGMTSVCTLTLCIRPKLVFLYRYIFKLGFLDGYPGFVWAFLASVYSFVKYAKLKEALERAKSHAREP